MKKVLPAVSVLALLTSSYCFANVSLMGNKNDLTESSTEVVYDMALIKKTDNFRILLTNDDGCRSPGILELRDKLVAKGYDVWVSAPTTNQSGIGTAITFKPRVEFTVSQLDAKTFCFPGTPADALDFGVVGILKDNPPDLVISGVNDGPNTGMAANNSGTVGAAIRAMRHGFPAIAASIGILPNESSQGFPSTKKYWPDTMDYVTNMVVELVDNHKQALKTNPQATILPKGSGISINYPPMAKEQIKGVKYVANQFNPIPQFYYELLPNGKTKQYMNPQLWSNNDETSDTHWLTQGYIIHTVMAGDWNGPQFVEQYQSLLTSDLLKD